MNRKAFNHPVYVQDGDHPMQEIACLEDALGFLREWPQSRRGPIHATAMRACRKAFETDYPLRAARSSFIGFARSGRILKMKAGAGMGSRNPWHAQAGNPPGRGAIRTLSGKTPAQSQFPHGS